MGKIIIFSAPSGAGKSTLVNYLMQQIDNLFFSVSATSRTPRGKEQNGVEYYFLSPEEFKTKIKNDEFVEYEEVYPDCFYGTLKSEVDKYLSENKNLLFDIDVKGGLNLKKIYAGRALAVFVQPPSIEELRNRLIKRNTDSLEMIEKRVAKATFEMTFASQFDAILVNDDIEKAKADVLLIVRNFLSKN